VLELGSANGTRVNGIALQIGGAQQIHNGDLLEMGRLRLSVYFGEPSA
jgi:predicted component of type VI protein secretion system